MSGSPPDSHVNVELIASALERGGLLVSRRGDLPQHITAITDDSRAVTPGCLFIAVRGSARDGHDFLDAAADRGASMVILEDESRSGLPALVVREGRRAAATAAAAFYGEPARELTLIAVTGTNGKTTTVNLLRHLLDGDGARSASIGTLGVLLGSEGQTLPGGGGLTTPGPVELQRALRALVTAGVRTVAMETSSHALHQRRVEGLRFAVGVFTNLTRDHLDYHGTMEAYFAAKAQLLDYIDPHGVAVINADDPAWRQLEPLMPTLTFGFTPPADVRASTPRYTPRGSEFTLHASGEEHAVRLPLIGDFNVANAVGAAAAAIAAGVAPATVASRLATMPQVPGRLEILSEQPTILRDYAHTPDALERALAAVRPFTPGKLTVVFGCGGDRDRGKRPEMGRIAERLADHVIITSDNPRTEDPEAILDDIETGMTAGNHERIEDRRTAIAQAIAFADAHDGSVVMLAGKGHETYQIRGTETLPFDEMQVVRELLAARTGAVR